jgi:hypothetical protein
MPNHGLSTYGALQGTLHVLLYVAPIEYVFASHAGKSVDEYSIRLRQLPLQILAEGFPTGNGGCFDAV